MVSHYTRKLHGVISPQVLKLPMEKVAVGLCALTTVKRNL